MMNRIIIVLVLFVSSCGYEPLYLNKQLEILNFKEIILTGETDVNDKIISSLNIKNKNLSSNKILIIDSKLNIEETSKNSKGQVDTYRTVCNVLLTIKEDGETIKNKSFNGNFTYSNMENKFDLLNYQNEIKKTIINKITEDIIIYLTL